MKNGVLEKRIPTVLGLLVLLVGLGVGVFLVSRDDGQDASTKAGPTATPKNIKVTNLGSNGFSVSWNTDTPVVGYLKYSADPNKITTPAGDIRDQVSGTANPYLNHYVNVTNLSPDQIYYFVIGSGPTTYKNQDKPFQTKTHAQSSPIAENVISGKIINSQGVGSQNTLVFVDVPGAETISTVTKTGGSWRLNLSQARNAGGNAVEITDTTNLTIFAQSETEGNANAQVNVANAKPTEDITLGKTQNFVATNLETSTESTKTVTESEVLSESDQDNDVVSSGFTSLASTAESDFLKLIYPALDGEMIATSTPEFRGETQPGTIVAIQLLPTAQNASVVTESDGQFRWTPQALSVGLYTLSLRYLNESEVEESLVRTLSIVASDGDMPAFTATPSATPIVTPTIMPATSSAELTDAGITDNVTLLSLGGLAMIILAWIMRRKIMNY
jgi:hypothetical protein